MAKNVKFTLFQYIAILFLFFFNIFSAGGQSDINPFINEESIRKLKSGYVLVRLESFEKKIQHYELAMSQSSCNEKCRERIQDKIDEILKNRDHFNIEFIKAFNKRFDFCKVLFYYDKDHTRLADNGFSTLVLVDDSLNTFETNWTAVDSFLIFKKGHTPQSENEGWLFQTKDGSTLDSGFPYISSNDAKTLMTYFSSSNHIKKNCDHMVRKINKELHKYYYKTERKRMEGVRVFNEEK